MMRTSIMIALALLVVLGGCGKSANKNGSTKQQQGATAPLSMSDDEAAALAAPQFRSGITLSLTDNIVVVNRLAALNGVDPSPLYGARYAVDGYPGCRPDGSHLVNVDISGFSFGPGVIEKWLIHEGLETTLRFSISYPNATMPQSFGSENVFQCAYMTHKFETLVQASQPGANAHSNVTVVIADRVFDNWTYENRYSTPIPGKGSVKVFAGTFAYHLSAKLPGVSFRGPGTGTVKMALDPDTGKWGVASFDLTEPTIMLSTQ